jgi:hypothetical protein
VRAFPAKRTVCAKVLRLEGTWQLKTKKSKRQEGTMWVMERSLGFIPQAVGATEGFRNGDMRE